MIDTGKDNGGVIAALTARGVAPGRPFPPYDTKIRITVGSDADMEVCKTVLADVLGVPAG